MTQDTQKILSLLEVVADWSKSEDCGNTFKTALPVFGKTIEGIRYFGQCYTRQEAAAMALRAGVSYEAVSQDMVDGSPRKFFLLRGCAS